MMYPTTSRSTLRVQTIFQTMKFRSSLIALFLLTGFAIVDAFAPSSQSRTAAQERSLVLLPPRSAASRPSTLGLLIPSVSFKYPVATKRRVLHLSSSRLWPLLGQSDSSSSDGAEEESTAPACWNPTLRRILGTIASLGALETSYLTYTKLSGASPSALQLLCSGTGPGGCSSVLNGPYSVVPGTSIPLAALGLVAYSTVAYLALAPLLLQRSGGDGTTTENSNDGPPASFFLDRDNRIALTALATTMGIVSIGLMVLLFGLLHQTCTYCIGSAILSISLTTLVWFGGALPQEGETSPGRGRIVGIGSATALAAVLYAVSTSGGPSLPLSQSSVLVASTTTTPTSQTLLAEASGSATSTSSSSSSSLGEAPPPILSTSTPRTLQMALQLQTLDAKLYGAFWCSHCYDQKEILGKQAMAQITYIECSKEGINPQTQLCRDKKIPGYPTWEIAGKLYPGEQALEELEDIIRDSQSSIR